MGGTNVVASMVVFKNGISDRGDYRKFKTRIDKNDDFYNMKETLARRLSEKNLKSWGRPDLILIDGGKGQLDAALQALEESGQFGFPFIGLAKRDEQIVVKNNTFPPHATHGYNSAMVDEHKLAELGGSVEISDGYTLINLPKSSPIIKLLQRVRDESHRFAVSYHTILRRVKQTSSSLEEIPGIGPKTRAKLIRKFGSIRNLKLVPESDIISQIGISKAGLVIKWLMVV
jgi:excinuclease ABC subunit C